MNYLQPTYKRLEQSEKEAISDHPTTVRALIRMVEIQCEDMAEQLSKCSIDDLAARRREYDGAATVLRSLQKLFQKV